MIWADILFIILIIVPIIGLIVAFISIYNDFADSFNSHLRVGDKIVFKDNEDVYTGVACRVYMNDITVKVKGDYFTISSSQVLEKLNRKKRFL